MKKRSSIVVYFLTFFTGSIYFFFWMFSLMREINILVGKKVFDVRKKVTSLLIVLALYLIFFHVTGLVIALKSNVLTTTVFTIGFALVVSWFVLIIRNLRQICSEIAIIESSKLNGNPISKNTATILFFIYFTAIPYIQSHMNKIIEGSTNSDIQIKNNKASIVKIVIGVIVSLILFTSALLMGIIQLIKNDDSYKTAIKYIESQSEISTEVGGIIGYGFFPTGSVQTSNGYGIGQIKINVKGKIKDLQVFIELEKEPNSDWTIKNVRR